MTQGVNDLINAIVSGDSVAIDTAFNNEMATRISTKLDDMRQNTARSMFATENVEEEDELDIEVQDTADTPVEESEVEEAEENKEDAL